MQKHRQLIALLQRVVLIFKGRAASDRFLPGMDGNDGVRNLLGQRLAHGAEELGCVEAVEQVFGEGVHGD